MPRPSLHAPIVYNGLGEKLDKKEVNDPCCPLASRMMMMVLLHSGASSNVGLEFYLMQCKRCAPNNKKSKENIDKSACSSTLVPGNGSASTASSKSSVL